MGSSSHSKQEGCGVFSVFGVCGLVFLLSSFLFCGFFNSMLDWAIFSRALSSPSQLTTLWATLRRKKTKRHRHRNHSKLLTRTAIVEVNISHHHSPFVKYDSRPQLQLPHPMQMFIFIQENIITAQHSLQQDSLLLSHSWIWDRNTRQHNPAWIKRFKQRLL